MANVVVYGRIHASGLSLLENAGHSVDDVPDGDHAALLAALPGADAVLLRTSPFGADAVAAARRLKIVSRHGVGTDNLDRAALAARGIPVAVVGDVNSVPTAEQTLALLLAALKRVPRLDLAARRGDFAGRNDFANREIAGKNALVVGFGRIGRRVAVLLAAFEAKVTVLAPDRHAKAIRDAGFVFAGEIETALPASDIVTLHCPATKDGKPLLDRHRLGLLPPGAVVINTARGSLIDEAALAEALQSGRVGAAGLDVYEIEPPRPDNPLFALANVVCSHHCAGITAESAIRMARISAQNVIDALAGRLDPRYVVGAG
ncbi:MAG: 3-phosphoglycerate dehydrogenase, partial [Alphaproteobacteria bacterium]|nr:3-phosphoglycerate dehydrogenase [Alphaproteobacteria bacterium]